MTDKTCVICNLVLREPFIACAECTSPQIYLCLRCFARGEELYYHQSNHKYEIVKNDFPILDKNWTAEEEILLLEAVCDCGFGNWEDISNQLPMKSKQECETHYVNCYIDNPTPPLLEFPEPDMTNAVFPSAITYKVSDDPPRPARDSQLYNDMAGYMAARGDFNSEYDNYAELDMCQMEFNEEDDDIDTDLKLAVLRIYNQRLRERTRRKKVIAKYGLIHVRKAVLSMRRYNGMLGRHVMEGLLGFMQLVEPMSFDMFAESLCHEAELKHRIKVLQEFRQMGLTRFFSTKLYTHLRQKRNDRKNKWKLLDNVLDHIQNDMTCNQWLHRNFFADTKGGSIVSVHKPTKRKPAPPIDITSKPGYEKLTPSERDLCARARILPVAYMEFKGILMSESERAGHISLGTARSTIKIDVNKTRQLYDFLVKSGLIISDKPIDLNKG